MEGLLTADGAWMAFFSFSLTPDVFLTFSPPPSASGTTTRTSFFPCFFFSDDPLSGKANLTPPPPTKQKVIQTPIQGPELAILPLLMKYKHCKTTLRRIYLLLNSHNGFTSV